MREQVTAHLLNTLTETLFVPSLTYLFLAAVILLMALKPVKGAALLEYDCFKMMRRDCSVKIMTFDLA